MNRGLLDGELLLTLNSCHVQGNFRWCMLSYSERCKKNLLLLNSLPIPTVQTESLSLVLDVFNTFLALIYLLCNRAGLWLRAPTGNYMQLEFNEVVLTSLCLFL